MPNAITRQDFATEAAHRLGIDSSLVREELKQAVATRRDQLPAHPQLAVSETERDLLRAISSEPGSPLFALVADAIDAHPGYFEPLGCASLFLALRRRDNPDPMSAVEEPTSRGMLARVLMAEGHAIDPGGVRAALESLRYNALQREHRLARAAISEAERRGDVARTMELTLHKQKLDQELRAFR
jgi:DNA primase